MLHPRVHTSAHGRAKLFDGPSLRYNRQDWCLRKSCARAPLIRCTLVAGWPQRNGNDADMSHLDGLAIAAEQVSWFASAPRHRLALLSLQLLPVVLTLLNPPCYCHLATCGRTIRRERLDAIHSSRRARCQLWIHILIQCCHPQRWAWHHGAHGEIVSCCQARRPHTTAYD